MPPCQSEHHDNGFIVRPPSRSELSVDDSYFPWRIDLELCLRTRAKFVCIRNIAHVAERNGSRRGPGMHSAQYDRRLPLLAISKLLSAIRCPLSNTGCGQIFSFHVWPKFIETKTHGSSSLTELFVFWRVSWGSALSIIQGRISTWKEPHCEERHAVPSFDTRDDAVTVRLL